MFNNIKKRYQKDFENNFEAPFNLQKIKNKLYFSNDYSNMKKERKNLSFSYVNLVLLFLFSIASLSRGTWLIFQIVNDDYFYYKHKIDVIFFIAIGFLLLALFIFNLLSFLSRKNKKISN